MERKYKGSFGAAVGDYVGSVYEGYGITPAKGTVDVFSYGNTITDDTVMTVAVADCLEHNDLENVEFYLKKWYRKYPHAGYGGWFRNWATGNIPQNAQKSFGNGAVMRISPVAYFAKSEEDAVRIATAVTIPSHSHEEAIKAARLMSVVLFDILHGKTKEEVLKLAGKMYDIDGVDYEALRRRPECGPAICQVTVPQALWLFKNSTGVEDMLKLGISMGQDNDTLLAIAVPLAEAYYGGIPEDILSHVKNDIPSDIKKVLEKI